MSESLQRTHLAPARLAPVNPGYESLYVPDEEGDERIALMKYWRMLLRYKWSVLMLALLAGIVGGLSAMSAVPIYRADVKILVKFPMPNFAAMQQFDSMPMHWLFYETQSDIIRSRAVAERVVDMLALDVPGRPADPPAPVVEAEPRWALWLSSLAPGWKDWVPAEWRPAPPAPLTRDQHRLGVINSVLGGLSVEGGQETEVLRISYESSDAERAAAIANAVASAYIEFGQDSRLRTTEETTSWLADRLDELRENVKRSEEALRAYQSREGLVDSGNREKIVSARLGTLTAELIRAQTGRSQAEARYQQVRRLISHQGGYETIVSLLNSTLVNAAHEKLVESERRVGELTERYGPKHPKMIATNRDNLEARRRLKSEIDKAVANAKEDYEVALTQEKELRRIIDAQQNEMRALSGKAFKLATLEREVDANRNLFDSFMSRFKEADVAHDYKVSNVRVIDQAEVPRVPVKPDKGRIVMMWVAFGVILGLALALLRDKLDNTFNTRESVEEKLGLSVIGMLEGLKLRRRDNFGPERYVFHEPRTPFSEAVNDIRTSIHFANIDDPPKVVLVTSSVAGEGKTTLASNLAVALSRRGRCLLLECDLRQGILSKTLGVASRPGLTDVVAGDHALKDAIVPDPEVPNLFVLVAGTSPPNPLEILSSKRFQKAFEELRRAFDYVVVDGAPVLPVSDSVIVGHQVDAVLLAVQANRTTHEMAQEALKRLLAARIEPIGAVLQQVDLRRLRSYSSNYASDSYGEYYAYQGSDTRPPD